MISILIRENEEWQSKFNNATGKNMRLKRKNDKDRELLAESPKKKAKIEEELKEKFQECLVGADCGIRSLNDKLK